MLSFHNNCRLQRWLLGLMDSSVQAKPAHPNGLNIPYLSPGDMLRSDERTRRRGARKQHQPTICRMTSIVLRGILRVSAEVQQHSTKLSAPAAAGRWNYRQNPYLFRMTSDQFKPLMSNFKTATHCKQTTLLLSKRAISHHSSDLRGE
jgi:hypothetical protein